MKKYLIIFALLAGCATTNHQVEQPTPQAVDGQSAAVASTVPLLKWFGRVVLAMIQNIQIKINVDSTVDYPVDPPKK